MRALPLLGCLILAAAAVCGIGNALTLTPQQLSVNGHAVQLMVPTGLQVDFIAPLAGPRHLALGPDDELLAGSRSGNVYRLPWPYSAAETLVSLPGFIHSVAYRNGMLFAAETAGLWAAPYSGARSTPEPGDFTLVTPLPSATGGHASRTVIVGPDNRLYLGLGISGNCSNEYLDLSSDFEHRRGGVFVLDETGASVSLMPFSSGLRNPIGLAFHPPTSQLYATNAGPDNLGFEQPPEVLAALEEGSFHGMPWFQYYDNAFRDGRCASSLPPKPASDATPPVATFAARSTPQGIAFVRENSMGIEFNGNALVAIHGSWAVPPGGDYAQRRPPKIVMVRFQSDRPTAVEDVITGFQRDDGSRFARPSGMVLGRDGSLYFSSDDGEVTGLFRLRALAGKTLPLPAVAPANSLLLDRR